MATVYVHEDTARVITGIRQGPPGPPGEPGQGSSDLPLSISNLQARDTLIFNGSAWANEPVADIVDGGNY